MKWTRLSLKNFLSHRDTTLKLTKINSITGPNGAGKSSIRDAIQWAITGSCRGMTQQKDGIGVIRQSAKKAEVDLLFEMNDQLYHINRNITPSTHNLSLTEVDGEMEYVGVAGTQPEIYKLLGITKEIAELMFDAYSIPAMKGNVRKQTLQRFFSASGKEALRKYLSDHGFGKLPEKHMEAILTAYMAIGLGTMDKGAYAYPVQQRRALKRELDALKSSGPREPDQPDGAPVLSVEALREELQALLDERDEAHALKSYDEGRLANLKESVIRTEATQAHLVENTEMDREMVEAKKTLAVDKRDAAMDLVETLKITPAEAMSTDLNQPERVRVKEALKQVEGIAGISVKSISALKARIRVLEPAEESQPEPESTEVDDTALSAAREALVTAQSEYAKVLEWAGQQAQGIENHGRNEEILRTLRKEIAEIEAAKDEITEEEKLGQVAGINEDIQTKQLEIEQRLIADIYENDNSDHVTKIKALDKKIVRWDSLAKALDPKNPDLSELLGDDFRSFATFVAADSERLGVKATVNTDFSIDVVTKDGPISNLEWASKSEQYRVGVALLFGICDLVGLKSVVLDEGEVVHGANRTAMRKLISSATGIESLILLETGDPHVQPSSKKHVTIHNIVDGALL